MTNKELENCMNEYGRDIYSFCRHLANHVQEADDLYQDTFLKAMELGANIDMEGNPKSYLLSIALRIWKNRKRKFAWRRRILEQQYFPKQQEDYTDENVSDSPEEQLLKREECRIVQKAVAGLPERQKIVILLYYMEGLAVSQIAEIAKIPAGTVKSRLHQARKSLKKELEDILI